ncbi:MAG: 50S ribosomal protein L35 [candidate division TM6 bacterium GW2011_GWF2_32_72]|nr:MAG: 50S ribosomal protein L35 [candidate division TM6 bacterium GW2011_GWF2_32_72]
MAKAQAKMKTRSAAKKRFKVLKSGAVKHGKAYRRHLLTKKSRKTKRNLRGAGYLLSADAKNMLICMPYA